MLPLLDRLRSGLRLPPTGWVLAGMLAFYVLAGLFGRDPWKGEDAIHLGTAWHILAHGDWLSPDLAGRPFDEPPLFYWSAALTGKLFGWLLPLHDAMRLASGAWMALALTGVYYAGRELYGQESAAATPLLLAGSAGLIVHAHEAQPLLLALTAYSGSLGAMAAFERRPGIAGSFYGIALAICLLGTGIAPTLPPLIAGLLAALIAEKRRRALGACLLGWLIFAILATPWPLALGLLEPARLAGWLAAEWRQFSSGDPPGRALGGYLGLLPWFSFPILPIAAWTFWIQRRNLLDRKLAVPLLFFAITLAVLIAAFRPKEVPALLLLPPLALLATPGALGLRRGAASAFDWFSIMTCSFFAALVWVGWSALVLGWPERLARRTVILRPGFVGQFDAISVGLALLATLWWLWLASTSPRSSYRSLVHWSMGLTTFWLLAVLLWLPWFDYGKSYRPVAQALARQVSADRGCMAEENVGDTQRASFAYFVGIEPLPFATPAGRDCPWLLIQSDASHPPIPPGRSWQKVWEGSRPGDRHEKFRLYRRE